MASVTADFSRRLLASSFASAADAWRVCRAASTRAMRSGNCEGVAGGTSAGAASVSGVSREDSARAGNLPCASIRSTLRDSLGGASSRWAPPSDLSIGQTTTNPTNATHTLAAPANHLVFVDQLMEYSPCEEGSRERRNAPNNPWKTERWRDGCRAAVVCARANSAERGTFGAQARFRIRRRCLDVGEH
jgi:hypothetical protein